MVLRRAVGSLCAASLALGVVLVLAGTSLARLPEQGTVELAVTPAGPLFRLVDLRPGDGESRAVSIVNGGTATGGLMLRAEARGDERWLERLRVRVCERGHTRCAYAGKLGALSRVELGPIGAGATRRLVLSVEWPRTATSAPATAEAARVDLTWYAVATATR